MGGINTKFKVGDKVRIHWDKTTYYALDVYDSVGVVVGHFNGSLTMVGGFCFHDRNFNLSFLDSQLELITPLIQTKPKTFMKKLSNFLTKTVDSETQLLLKAGLINGDLEPTSEGRDVLTEVLWFQNLEQIVTRAQEIVTEAEKESK
jgi:hypothetical protein